MGVSSERVCSLDYGVKKADYNAAHGHLSVYMYDQDTSSMSPSASEHFQVPQLITWSCRTDNPPTVPQDHPLKHPIDPSQDNTTSCIVQDIGYAIDSYSDSPSFLDNDTIMPDEKHSPYHLVNIYGWLFDNVRITPRWPYQPEDPMVSEKLGCRTI
ncbi:hypothetical protein BDY19DRAFT_616435 [Irpex rosettiformis]|uniref:Uncharacterized protein n=1 Tax=Irpex rosettiformis TaxID=378272 RepID=A0ACB8TNX9_9APHY|nr:hypothetical protein BDY19DRAFT_616435 [Irpex rosettiformis]